MGAYVELLKAQRDTYRKQRDELLEAVHRHEQERSHGPTANMEYADRRLHETARRIREEGER